MAPDLAQTPFRHSDLHNFLCTCHRLSHRPMALPIPTDLLITRDNPRKGERIKRRLSGGSRLSRLATFVVELATFPPTTAASAINNHHRWYRSFCLLSTAAVKTSCLTLEATRVGIIHSLASATDRVITYLSTSPSGPSGNALQNAEGVIWQTPDGLACCRTPFPSSSTGQTVRL